MSTETTGTDKRLQRERRVSRGIICTLLGGTLWGLNGVISKILMDTYAVDPLWLTFMRELGSCWFFIAAAALTDRKRLSSAVHSVRALLTIMLVGVVALLFSNVSYIEAVSWTNPATATVMQSLGMVGVLFYTCSVSKRAPRRREVLGILLALIGTYLVATGGNPGELNLPVGGFIWGLLCAAASACLAIVPTKALNKWGSFVVNGFGFLFSAILLGLFIHPWTNVPALDLHAILLLIAIIVLGSFGAYALYLQGIKDAGSLKASLLGTIEPVVSTIGTVLLLGYHFSLADILGFALIIIMVYLTA